MEEFYNSSIIIWTSFHQVSIFIFLSTVFPLFNLLEELLHPPEDSGCENLYLGGWHVQWIVLALSYFLFTLSHNKNSIYIG